MTQNPEMPTGIAINSVKFITRIISNVRIVVTQKGKAKRGLTESEIWGESSHHGPADVVNHFTLSTRRLGGAAMQTAAGREPLFPRRR